MIGSLLRNLKFVVPNGFTGLSLLLGLASVSRSVVGDFELAAWMILWGVLLDKLDGSAARLLRASSPFGAQFDSFADFVVFGIAPSALLYFKATDLGLVTGSFAIWMAVAVGAYVLATAGRLARFNISEPPDGDRIFYGFPTTLVGALIGSAFLSHQKYGLDPAVFRGAPLLMLISAMLMVSNVRLPKLKLRRSRLLNAFQVTNVAVVYVCGPLMLFPEYLFFSGMLYTVVGVAYCAVVRTPPDAPSQTTREATV